MEQNEIANAISEIADAIGVASSKIVPYYAKWHVISSIGYMLFALFLWIGGIIGYKIMIRQADKSKYEKDLWTTWAYIVLVIALVVGSLVFFAQVSDLFAPQGIAIHQLIRDIRG